MSLWSRLSGKDAYKKSRKQYQSGADLAQQQFQQSQQMLQPYVNYGTGVAPQYMSMMEKLMNPAALQDEFMQSYAPSDYAKQTAQMAGQSGLDVASSMGMMGSTPAMQSIQAGTANIMAEDKQRYLDQLMNKYMAGANIASNIYGTGATAAGNQANIGSQSALARQSDAGNIANLIYGQGSASGRALGNLAGGGLSALLAAYGMSRMPTGGAGSVSGGSL